LKKNEKSINLTLPLILIVVLIQGFLLKILSEISCNIRYLQVPENSLSHNKSNDVAILLQQYNARQK